MTVVKLLSGCKINLGLRIVGVRPDGMHLIDSLFWPLTEPHDELFLTPRHDERIVVRCGNGIDPLHNTLTRAHTRFRATAGRAPGIDVELVKGVPSGAGLGGGSADAATLLLWLNQQAGFPLSRAELADCAAAVGADVPFFLDPRPSHVQGIGERITPVPELIPLLAGWGLLLLCPDIRVSTPWAYAAWDRLQSVPAENCLTTLASKDNYEAFRTLGAELSQKGISLENDFEPVVFKQYPRLESLKASLLDQGAAHAAMSGSGSALIGLFPPSHAEVCPVLARQWREQGLYASGQRLSFG